MTDLSLKNRTKRIKNHLKGQDTNLFDQAHVKEFIHQGMCNSCYSTMVH